MSESLRREQPTITSLLQRGKSKLEKASISSSQLDAELLLAHSIGVNRVWLRTHDQDIVPRKAELLFLSLIDRRSNYEPVAYLIGSKEFYSYEFKVTKDTLVPRPESEAIITFLIEEAKDSPNPNIIDVGTGSGALGITAKLQLPNAKVLLTDISHEALAVARQNAEHHNLEVGFVKTSILDRLHLPDGSFILANLPYVDRSWDFLSKELSHEPQSALYANEGGLELINELLNQVHESNARNIMLFIESDTSQQDTITKRLQDLNFKIKNKSDFVIVALKD